MESRDTAAQKAFGTILPIVAFLILAAVFCRHIFSEINNWGICDWDQHFLYHAVPRKTLTEYHQFPFWNPYYCGGNVLLANPQSRFLSPLFLLELVFGTVIGLKLEIWAHLVVGMFGMYLIATKIYRLPPVSSFFPPVIFMLSGMYAFNLAVGHTNFMSVAYVPVVYYFYVRGIDDLRSAIIAGFFMALMVFEGGTYTVPHTALFLVVTGLLMSIQRRSLLPARTVVVIGITACAVSAIKLLPVLEMLQLAPRHTVSTDTLTLDLIYRALLDRGQSLSLKGLPGQIWGWEEYAHYIGFMPLLMALAGGTLKFREEWPLLVAGLIFLILALGSFADLSPWHILHQFPLFKSQRVPSRFMQYFVFAAALSAGFVAAWLESAQWGRIGKKGVLSAIFLLLAVITADLISVNSGVFAEAFPNRPPRIQSFEFFRQIVGDSAAMYEGFLRNRGTIDGYEEVHLPIHAQALNDQQYKTGEVYFVGNGTATLQHWSPNSITTHVNGTGYLLINQNFAPDWHATNNHRILSLKGLVATRVDGEDTDITISYRPRSFFVGAIVTLIGSVLSILVIMRKRSGGP